MSNIPSRLTLETRGHVLLVGLHRAEKRNAFDLAMLRELAAAFTRFDDDDELRCAASMPCCAAPPLSRRSIPRTKRMNARSACSAGCAASRWWSRCRAGA